MTSRPMVSVIIPVKDGESHLADAIESVLAQDYQPLELIVIDGDSSDRSADIARSYEPVRLLEQRGTGLAGAWNQAIEASTGDLIAFLDSDDIWMPGTLSARVRMLLPSPHLAGVDGLARFELFPGAEPPPGFREELLEGEHPAHMPGALVVRREVFDEVGYFDPEYLVALDVDWWARVKDAGLEFGTLPELVLIKRFYAGNLSHARPEVYNREILRSFRASAARQRGATG